MSTEQDLNLHPSVSGRVPLPLDHLHSCFLLLFNSYPRAFLLCLIQDLDTAHVHYMHRVLWNANVHVHRLLLVLHISYVCAKNEVPMHILLLP